MENLKNMAREKGSTMQQAWLHHGTRHHTDSQLQSLEHTCKILQVRITFDVMESHRDVQSNILKEGLGAKYPRGINKYKNQKYFILEKA